MRGSIVRSMVMLGALASVVAACGGSDDTSDGSSVDATAADATTPDTDSTDRQATTTDTAGGTTASAPDGTGSEQEFPDVVEATAMLEDTGWAFDVTISSPYDSTERYADAWRVVGPDGTVFGVRELTHDHAAEQPFTRSLSGIEIPDDVARVTIEGRDLVNGWGGATVPVDLDAAR